MKGKIEYVFPTLRTGDVLVDKTNLRWEVHSWSGTLEINLITPVEYPERMISCQLGYFGSQEEPCLVGAKSGAAIGAFLGMDSVEVVRAVTNTRRRDDLDPRCPDSPTNWENNGIDE